MKKNPYLSYVNGKPEQKISLTDRGLSYGDGLFETILYLNGQYILLDEHIERLTRDSRRLDIDLDKNCLTNELQALSSAIHNAGDSTGVVKIIITRQFTGRGYGYSKKPGSNRVLQFYAGLSYPKENLLGIRLSLADHRLPVNKKLAGIKHLNRLDQVIAQQGIHKPFYQEAIVLGAGSEVIECISSNIFIANDGQLLTPDLTNAGVQGVMRDYIRSTIAPRLNLATAVKKLYLDDLMKAEEIFICNSVLGVWPVKAVNVREYAVGAVSKAIQQEINKLGYKELYQ